MLDSIDQKSTGQRPSCKPNDYHLQVHYIDDRLFQETLVKAMIGVSRLLLTDNRICMKEIGIVSCSLIYIQPELASFLV